MLELADNQGCSLRDNVLQSLPKAAAGLIDGEVDHDSDVALELVDPDTGEGVSTLSETKAEKVGHAVAIARQAFQSGSWSNLSIDQRAKVLRKAASAIRDGADYLAAVDSITTGLLFHASTSRHVLACAAWFDTFADFAEGDEPIAFRTSQDIQTSVVRAPVGVVALYTPWNIPLMAVGLKLAAALVMGNSVIIKPSELSPFGTLRLVEILHEAGVPSGVLHLVNGRGCVTGRALAEHQDVGAISFTGGPVAGAQIASTAAGRFAKVTMELGGKSANIVLADAPFDAAVEGSVQAAFANNGQACLAGSRILVEESIADRFIAGLVDRTKALRIGHTFDEVADIGAQSSVSQMDRVLSHMNVALAEGAEFLCGGRRAPGFAGCQVEPTIARVSSNNMRVCQEEVFGPLVTIQVVRDAAQAVAIANDTRLGLAGYVWSEDEKRAQEIAGQLRTGTVMINTPFVRERAAPFGGFGESGIDREGGRWSLDFYSEAKTIVTNCAIRGAS